MGSVIGHLTLNQT